jgi:hypothetical protein
MRLCQSLRSLLAQGLGQKNMKIGVAQAPDKLDDFLQLTVYTDSTFPP